MEASTYEHHVDACFGGDILPKNTAANDGGEEAILVPEMKVTAGDEKDGKRTVDITVTGEKGVAAGSITLIWGEETKTVDLDKKGRASITVEGC